VGRSGASFGVVSYAPVDFWPLNTALYVIDFHGNDERFACYFLKAFDFGGYNSGSAQPSLNRNFVHPIPIEIPPLPEQRAIAHILGTLDDKIELNRRMNATLEAMARALFKSWFVDFDPVRAKMEGRDTGLPTDIAALFPDRLVESEVGEVPDGWEVGTIADCCINIQNGGTPRRDEPSYWDPAEIPWLISGEVRQPVIVGTQNYISKKGMANSSAKWLTTDSTVVALYGATAGQVSFIAADLTTNQAITGLIPKPSLRYYNYLKLSDSVASLANLARGSAQQNISKGIVEEVETIIPTESVLQAFDAIVNAIFDRWVANLRANETLAALRDALLPRLLSGEVRAPDLERING
jgi:type I restriction enzyme S subunit